MLDLTQHTTPFTFGAGDEVWAWNYQGASQDGWIYWVDTSTTWAVTPVGSFDPDGTGLGNLQGLFWVE
ncbi:MAG: hypothetical protein EP330_26235 [Deltaproteobacteria bacterium]|nr:MAG: hypothetical protein EP330_26235 [Deltaproteobacteria bacterium]